MGDKSKGLYEKFTVRRTDGRDAPGEKHEGCRYFVLDLDHDPHALPALRAYGASCRVDGYDALARDLALVVFGKTLDGAESDAIASTADLSPDALERIADAMARENAALCDGEKEWRMGIPARATDSDLVFGDGERALRAVAARDRAAASAAPREGPNWGTFARWVNQVGSAAEQIAAQRDAERDPDARIHLSELAADFTALTKFLRAQANALTADVPNAPAAIAEGPNTKVSALERGDAFSIHAVGDRVDSILLNGQSLRGVTAATLRFTPDGTKLDLTFEVWQDRVEAGGTVGEPRTMHMHDLPLVDGRVDIFAALPAPTPPAAPGDAHGP